MIQLVRSPSPAMPAKAKETEAATVIAETVRTVPTFTIILATIVDVITFCWSCVTNAFLDH